jgi:prepilin-type N-terminal cleavage/methylation domain-containing protein
MKNKGIFLNSRGGFTLIELLVVIAIIGLLSSVVLASLSSARAKARDAKRTQDLVQIRTALALYYNDKGTYPLPYPQTWGGVSTAPCGINNTILSGPNAYIAGLAPTYISILPTDPAAPGSCNGYLYTSDGTNYKFLVHGSAESYPGVGQRFYDPARPNWAWMICSENPVACNTW